MSAAGGARVDRRELGEATSHGQLYVDRLRAAHLTLSGIALVAFGGLVGALPLVALALPSLEAHSVLGIPVPVLLLLAPYPVFVVIGAVYAGRADGLDATFAALVDEAGEGVEEAAPVDGDGRGDGGSPAGRRPPSGRPARPAHREPPAS